MIYIKCKKEDFGDLIRTENNEILIEIFEDMFYSRCPKCKEEHHIKFEDVVTFLKNGGDFSGSSYFCRKCSIKQKQ